MPTPAMISRSQIALVQDNFAQVVPISAAAAKIFYDRLFALAPETRVLFKNDMAEQGRKLFMTLATVVDGLDDLEGMTPVIAALAVRHVGYNAQDSHYAAVGEALIDTLRAGLAHRFTAEAEAAWRDAYALLSGIMIDAAHAAA